MNSKLPQRLATAVRAHWPQIPPQGWEGEPSFTPPDLTPPRGWEDGLSFTPPEPLRPGRSRAKNVRPGQDALSRKRPSTLFVRPGDCEIGRLAYDIWERRGRPPHQALSHWLAAESELLSTATRRALIERVSAAIAAGSYETNEKIDLAIDRLLERVT